MGLLRWFTRNWADTDEATHADIVPRSLPDAPEAALERVAAIIDGRSRWAVVAKNPAAGTLHATHRTGFFRFVDDVHLRFEALPDGTTRLHARSKSRLGKGDMGQNRRNLLELFHAIEPQRGDA